MTGNLELGSLAAPAMNINDDDSAVDSIWCAACTFCIACGLSPSLAGVAAYASF